MHLYMNILGIQIPSYGAMIVLGLFFANSFAFWLVKHKKMDLNDFIIMEAYCVLGAFFGAKLLFVMISWREIDWKRIFEAEYFNLLMRGGFVFYGGFIGGVLLLILAGKFHKIDAITFLRTFTFLIPFIHAFGRVGCFCSGCCYGRVYNGPGAVVFPMHSYAPSGIPLFPVQLVESGALLIIALVIFVLQVRREFFYTLELYLILYGITRFILEYLRFDEVRGRFGWFYTSQWISIALVIFAIFSIIYHKNKRKNTKTA